MISIMGIKTKEVVHSEGTWFEGEGDLCTGGKGNAG